MSTPVQNPRDEKPLSVQLANTILDATVRLEKHLSEQNVASPSLQPGADIPRILPPNVQAGVGQALDALHELNVLLLGPIGFLMMHMGNSYSFVSIQALQRFGIPSLIPESGSISIEDLANQCCDTSGRQETMCRLIQHAAAQRILSQPQAGHVSHSSLSHLMATNSLLMDHIASFSSDMWPAAARVVDAMQKWPDSQQANQTAYNLTSGSNLSFFQTLAAQPEKASRFTSSMRFMQTLSPNFQPTAAIQKFNWATLTPTAGKKPVVVDVGGSDGTLAHALIELHPHLDIVVQDLPNVVASAQPHYGITFQAHDFFTEQPVQEADVYLLRRVLHDWSDQDATRILQQLIPALKPGARILINEFVIASPGTALPVQQRLACNQDLVMLSIFNGKERPLEQWKNLVTGADPRFRINSINHHKSEPLALIEVVWMGE